MTNKIADALGGVIGLLNRVHPTGYKERRACEVIIPLVEAVLKVVAAAKIVIAQDTGDVWTDDHGWVRPINPGTVNALETALSAYDAAVKGEKP